MQNWGEVENAVELELPEGCARGFVWIEICVHHNGESSKPNCVEVGKFKLEYLVELSMARYDVTSDHEGGSFAALNHFWELLSLTRCHKTGHRVGNSDFYY